MSCPGSHSQQGSELRCKHCCHLYSCCPLLPLNEKTWWGRGGHMLLRKRVVVLWLNPLQRWSLAARWSVPLLERWFNDAKMSCWATGYHDLFLSPCHWLFWEESSFCLVSHFDWANWYCSTYYWKTDVRHGAWVGSSSCWYTCQATEHLGFEMCSAP